MGKGMWFYGEKTGITNGHQNYEKCECSDQCIKKEPEGEK